MHNGLPNQRVRILTINISVQADYPTDDIADEISAILTGALCADDTALVDWQYANWQENPRDPIEVSPIVTLSKNPEEGESFEVLS